MLSRSSHGLQIFARRQNPVRANQTQDLPRQRVEGGEIDEPEHAQEYPPCDQVTRRALRATQQPSNCPRNLTVHELATLQDRDISAFEETAPAAILRIHSTRWVIYL